MSDIRKDKKVTVLIVDDEKFIVKMWEMSLEKRGYDAVGYSSSLAALEAFRVNPAAFDIVMTDQTMPDMTGGELAAELVKIRSDIPVIICSGYSEPEDNEKKVKTGIKGYLVKPFDINQLDAVIKRLIH